MYYVNQLSLQKQIVTYSLIQERVEAVILTKARYSY